MHVALRHTDHRPFPMPSPRWAFRQRWCDLLFAHWPIAPTALRPHVPAELEIDEFDGTSWVGVVPFRMESIAPRHLPPVPGVSAFPELNLRLYVRHRGVPGVWFVSLDASSSLAVWAANRFFHLPYFHATMSCRRDLGDRIAYASERRRGSPPVTFRGEYGPTSSDVFHAKAGSLDAFLVERYCLFAKTASGALLRGDIHHAPWPLQRASVNIEANTIGSAQGIALDGPPTTLHFSRAVDVILWRFSTVIP